MILFRDDVLEIREIEKLRAKRKFKTLGLFHIYNVFDLDFDNFHPSFYCPNALKYVNYGIILPT